MQTAEAARARKKAWYTANKAKVDERKNAWIAAHPDKHREHSRKSKQAARAADPDRHREMSRVWYAADPDKHRARSQAWRAANYFRARVRELQRRRASTVTASDLTTLWEQQDGICALWGVPMTFTIGKGHSPTNMSVDRIDGGRPYTPDNIRLVCHQANLMRSTMTDEELIQNCVAVLRTIASKTVRVILADCEVIS